MKQIARPGYLIVTALVIGLLFLQILLAADGAQVAVVGPVQAKEVTPAPVQGVPSIPVAPAPAKGIKQPLSAEPVLTGKPPKITGEGAGAVAAPGTIGPGTTNEPPPPAVQELKTIPLPDKAVPQVVVPSSVGANQDSPGAKHELNPPASPMTPPSASEPTPLVKRNRSTGPSGFLTPQAHQRAPHTTASPGINDGAATPHDSMTGSQDLQQNRVHEIFRRSGAAATLAVQPDTADKSGLGETPADHKIVPNGQQSGLLLLPGGQKEESGPGVPGSAVTGAAGKEPGTPDQTGTETQPPVHAGIVGKEAVALTNDLLAASGVSQRVDDPESAARALDFIGKAQKLGGEINQRTWDTFEGRGGDAVLQDMVVEAFGIPDSAGLGLQDLINGIAAGNKIGVGEGNLHGFLQDWRQVNEGSLSQEELLQTWVPGTAPGQGEDVWPDRGGSGDPGGLSGSSGTGQGGSIPNSAPGVDRGGTGSSDLGFGGLAAGNDQHSGGGAGSTGSSTADRTGGSTSHDGTTDGSDIAGNDRSSTGADPLGQQPGGTNDGNPAGDANPGADVADTGAAQQDSPLSTGTNQASPMDTGNETRDITPDGEVLPGGDIGTAAAGGRNGGTSPAQDDMAGGQFSDLADAFLDQNQGDGETGVFTVETVGGTGYPDALTVGVTNDVYADEGTEDTQTGYGQEEGNTAVGWGMSSPGTDSSGDDGSSNEPNQSHNEGSSGNADSSGSSGDSGGGSSGSSESSGGSSGSSDDSDSSGSSENSDNSGSSDSSDNSGGSDSSDSSGDSGSSAGDSSGSDTDESSLQNPDNQRYKPSKAALAAFIDAWSQSNGGQDKVSRPEEGNGPHSRPGSIRITREDIKAFVRARTESQILTSGDGSQQNDTAAPQIIGRQAVRTPADIDGSAGDLPFSGVPDGLDRDRNDPHGGCNECNQD